jgi:NADP-dependent aldehyde dehydrogenase
MSIKTQVDETVQAAAAHRRWQLQSPLKRADVLRHLAASLDARREDILTTCADETALTIDELTPEFARMTATFRMFAAAITDGTWHVPAIDTRVPANIEPKARAAARLIGPNHDIRRTMIVRGAVVAVFGASNFPLAYGVCGGDTASALAAGCRVVVKEHPAHPQTGRLIHRIANAALREAGFDGALGYVENLDSADTRPAKALIAHEAVCAVGFTGSTRGGLAIDKLCRERNEPITAFCEMGSCNRASIDSLERKSLMTRMVKDIAASVITRVGQQCTEPGVVDVVEGGPSTAGSRAIYSMFAKRFADVPARRMLSMDVARNFYRRLDESIESGEIARHTRLPTKRERAAGQTPPIVMLAKARLTHTARLLSEEMFGPAIVVAPYRGCCSPSLAFALYQNPDHLVVPLHGAFVGHTGRFVVNGVTTGVRVGHAMVHGGPWPATNAPESTAVGPMAIARWCRPVCYQNTPDAMLPDELKDANPLRWMRLVNGKYTRRDVARPSGA